MSFRSAPTPTRLLHEGERERKRERDSYKELRRGSTLCSRACVPYLPEHVCGNVCTRTVMPYMITTAAERQKEDVKGRRWKEG
jgi:hypothetical protein